MKFLSTLIIIYLVWQVFKWLAKWALRYWMIKNGGKAFYYSSGFGGQRTQASYPDGEVKVDSVGSKSAKNNSRPGSELGEYVDYEEVK